VRPAIRQYEHGDLARILDLWERTGALPVGKDGLSVDQAVDLAIEDSSVALVAEVEGNVVGMVLGATSGVVGFVYRLDVYPELADQGVEAELLGRLQAALAQSGARKLFSFSRADGRVVEALQAQGFEPVPEATCLERDVPTTVPVRSALLEMGGQLVAPGLWDELRGLDEAKAIIERRVILPLAEPELASRHSVFPPKAIVLFGPPGTGKTTFAKGIASRLGWPFIEIQPSELAEEGAEREAKLLARLFERVLELPSAVVFVDEVEDLASIRHEDRRVSPSITNEFLKQIPRLREAAEHLLVCATNWISRLDDAFLRPGRFDYILPVGPPDKSAREAIWGRYVGRITDREVDVGALVEASELFTPADIEFAAGKAAQHAFEREHFGEAGYRAQTDDFLAAVRHTRPTLSAEMVEGFNQETERYARY
jgi:transitional endoplasmic reticulum ATPase